MPAASVVIPAGALRFARAPRPGLLPATRQKAQISAGLSFCLDEKRGSRHRPSLCTALLAHGNGWLVRAGTGCWDHAGKTAPAEAVNAGENVHRRAGVKMHH